MATGSLKWFDPEKGYGFIARDGDKDVFLHARALTAAGINGEKLERGAKLAFDLEEGEKGAKAVNVSLAA